MTSQVADDIALPGDFRVPAACAPRSLDGRVLLTGTTGFLGGHLLRELLHATSATVYCLVRAGTLEDCHQRIRAALMAAGGDPPSEHHAARIIPVVGDLAAPSLGLSPQDFDRLAELVDVVIHNGALVRFLSPYRLLRAPNVLGTREILRLATQGRTKWLHFISTLAILRGTSAMSELDDITPLGRSLRQGYALSKWAAEMLLDEARRRGALVTISRLGYVSGVAETGVSSTDDARTLFMKACRQLRAAPQLDRLVDMAPVDRVARAIVLLAGRPGDPGTFHLVNHRSPSWGTIVEALSAIGPRLESIGYADWRGKLHAIKSGPDAWLRLFREDGTHGWLVDDATVEHRRSDASLAELGFEWPVVDRAVVDRYLRYYLAAKAI